MNNQRSTHDQLEELLKLGNKEGLYDAVSWVIRAIEEGKLMREWFKEREELRDKIDK